jgi:ubiquinone biosynthesis protein COQ9
MMDLNRLQTLKTVLSDLHTLSSFYTNASPGWTLIQNAWRHIDSIYHLEKDTNFDKKTLGVKQDEHDET